MRDLLFKNLTSPDKRRKRISIIEIIQNQEVRTEIRRHFTCLIREVITLGGKEESLQRQSPYLYVLKRHDTKEKREGFFCKLKGSLYVVNNGRLYSIIFCHSLKINLKAIPEVTKI